MLTKPVVPEISKIIPPNLSTWQTIELTHQCAKYVIDNNISGMFVECGIAAGNNLAAMCLAGRFGFGFDSFEGIPWAGEHDTQQPGIGAKNPKKSGLSSSGISAYSQSMVEKNMKSWGIENYSLVKGWFENTVQFWGDDEISVLRLDGDLYSSTMVCLIELYPYLSKGGILIMDDWNLDGCRKAFFDYFGTATPELVLDDLVTYWKK